LKPPCLGIHELEKVPDIIGFTKADSISTAKELKNLPATRVTKANIGTTNNKALSHGFVFTKAGSKTAKASRSRSLAWQIHEVERAHCRHIGTMAPKALSLSPILSFTMASSTKGSPNYLRRRCVELGT
jgi:hypothetical protein